MGSDDVSHCFPLNGNVENPEIAGIENVIQTYKENSGKIKLLGPTQFSPIMRQVRDQINKDNNKKMYYILLILTDGEIHDMEETMAEIESFSKENLPVSIIIVGIGSENFSNMVRLDGDDIELAKGCRDLVQFVKFEDIMMRSNKDEANENLAALVLEEVP
jgi:hypothetical protein